MPKNSPEALIASARKKFHASLLKSILTINEKGCPSNADSANTNSIRIANGIVAALQSTNGQKEKSSSRLAAQISGNVFEETTTTFIEETFSKLSHLRPGDWRIEQVGNRNRRAIAEFEQYAHLIALDAAAKDNRELRAALGSDYTITPDIIVVRGLVSDDALNAPAAIVDDTVSSKASLRKKNGGKPILHASISTKWTIRSDRSQNSRTEALNLIRNRKGRLPHIVVVTGEPLPTRLASIALGTGDIDCVYHFALYELIQAVKDAKDGSALDMLDTMIDGKRLKDISDLPLDLAI